MRSDLALACNPLTHTLAVDLLTASRLPRPEDLALRDKLIKEKEEAQAEQEAMDRTMLETKQQMKSQAKAEKKAKVRET